MKEDALQPYEYNTANLIESLSFYGERSDCAGLTLVTAPVDYAAFNVAVFSTPVEDATELLFRVNAAANHFRELGRAWNLYICEDLLDPHTARHVDSYLDPMSMVRILDAPGMEAAELAAPRRPLPELDYEAVTTARARLAFAGLISDAFHIPHATSRALYTREEKWSVTLRAWVGFVNGKPVTCAAATAHAGVLGIYSVATLPTHRRRGYAEAVVHHAVSEYRRDGFSGGLILQSTPDGRRLYRDMGFTRTTRFSVYATI